VLREEGVFEIIEIEIRIVNFLGLKGLVLKMCIYDELALILFLEREGHVEFLIDSVSNNAGHDLDIKIKIRLKNMID
jgi:hypothetical protein